MEGIETVRQDRKIEGLDGFIAVGYYHDPRLRAVIRGLKYRNATCLDGACREVLRRYAETRIHPWPWAGESTLVVQPVVGAPNRIRTRGFDPAAFVAAALKKGPIPWAAMGSLLERKTSVSTQADLPPDALRQANVKGVFSVRENADIPEAVLLTDDVFTTGATMREAARILREAGVKRVYGFVLALGA
ncbi:ComF family protein [Candidatus Uhrbacteria bacterium]|nr:ComF family protein [Candidatus Uhrbacteria bacterium]